MAAYQLAEGDLFAYLHGQIRPGVEDALRNSPEAQQNLAALAKLDRVLTALFAELGRPEPQDLVDVLTNQATPRQRLAVAAYTRVSERGRREMAALEEELASLEPNTKPPPRFTLFWAQPLTAALGLRASGGETMESMYQAIDLQIQILLRLTPPIDRHRAIEGLVTQNFVPLDHIQLALQPALATPVFQQTDADGFFRFENVRDGTYHLNLCLAEGIVQIENIVLKEE